MRQELIDAKAVHEEKIKSARDVRDEASLVVMLKFNAETKDRVSDAYQKYMSKLGSPNRTKSKEEWAEIHALEDMYLQVQKEVKVEVPKLRRVKDVLLLSYSDAYDKTVEKLEDEYAFQVELLREGA